MRTAIINEVEYNVDDHIKNFGVQQKPSSNIEFFGCNPFNHFFVQFKNGTTYIYSGVSNEILYNLDKAESIGKFFNSQISGKHESVKLAFRVVTPKKSENE